MRAPFIIAPACVAITGYIVLLSVPSNVSPGGAYVGTILAAAGIYPACAIGLSWPANNVSGQTKRATSCAMQISIGNLGAVMGTQLYRTEYAPRFFVGHGVACGYMVANILVVSTLWLVLAKENKKKESILRSKETAAPVGSETKAEPGSDVVEPWKGDEDPSWKFQT